MAFYAQLQRWLLLERRGDFLNDVHRLGLQLVAPGIKLDGVAHVLSCGREHLADIGRRFGNTYRAQFHRGIGGEGQHGPAPGLEFNLV